MSEALDILVIGAGPWGLASAWRAARARAHVRVLDDGAPAAAHVAAGMLGSHAEAREDEQDLFELLREASGVWRQFAADLGAAAGRDCGYRRSSGALAVAARPEQVGLLRHRADTLAAWGHPTDWLSARQLRRRERGLGPAVLGGLLFADEHQVQTRLLLSALRAACAAAAVDLVDAGAAALTRDGRARVRGAVDRRGTAHRAEVVVMAAGHASGRLSDAVPMRPVKGQILRLRSRRGAPVPLTHTVRAPSVYLAPRDDQVVVGATSEERSDRDATAGGVHQLLDEALHVAPALAEMELAEVAVGLRPATADGRPAIGRDDQDLLWAGGGYRHGVLLTPVVAQAVVAIAAGAGAPAAFAALSPLRFAHAGART